jgi:hypothetical protein
MVFQNSFVTLILAFVVATIVLPCCIATRPSLRGTDESLVSNDSIVGGDSSVRVHQPNHRQLQYSNGNTCGVTGFSVYNSFTGQWVPLASIVIDKIPHTQLILDTYSALQTINIQTHVDMSGCAATNRTSTIGCVKTNVYNTSTVYDYSPPYTALPIFLGIVETRKPPRTGFQNFDVELYESSTCTGPILCEDKLYIHVINSATKFMRFGSMQATYNGVNKLPANAVGQQLVNATCEYIKNAIKYGFLVPGSSLSFGDDEWKCTAPIVSGIPPTMTYYFNVKFVYSPMVSVFDNSDAPTNAVMVDYVTRLFANDIPGAGYKETMIEYLKKPSTGLVSNPYYSYTNITLVKY